MWNQARRKNVCFAAWEEGWAIRSMALGYIQCEPRRRPLSIAFWEPINATIKLTPTDMGINSTKPVVEQGPTQLGGHIKPYDTIRYPDLSPLFCPGDHCAGNFGLAGPGDSVWLR